MQYDFGLRDRSCELDLNVCIRNMYGFEALANKGLGERTDARRNDLIKHVVLALSPGSQAAL